MMQLDVFYQMKQSHSQCMSPTVIKGMQLLELPYHALTEFVEKATLENPFLAYDYTNHEEEFSMLYAPQRRDSGEEHPFLDPASFCECQDPMESLQESLRLQMLSSCASSAVTAAGLYIIQRIDRRGYCSMSLAEMVMSSPYSEIDLRQALSLIQTFSPKGVGAFSLCECLKLQIDVSHPDYQKICTLLNLPLEVLERRNLKELARCCCFSTSTVQRILNYLSTLNPAPGLAYLAPEPVGYILPEIAILSQHNEAELWLRDGTRLVVLDEAYFRQLSDYKYLDADTEEYISVKYQEAKALAEGLAMRQKVMEQLMKYLLIAQRDYFLNPAGQLKPLTMRQAAQALQIHPSTITRCVNDKYIQTRTGVIPLRSLFSAGLPSCSEQSVSPDTIKRMLLSTIQAEAPDHPLDDTALTARLIAAGITISRRTVTKYRQQIGIPNSKERTKKG